MSGVCGLRLAVVMASARTVPAASCPMASDMLEKASCTSPETTAAVASAPPRYGTEVNLESVLTRKISAANCIRPPAPTVP
jgi:hypothetical protein